MRVKVNATINLFQFIRPKWEIIIIYIIFKIVIHFFLPNNLRIWFQQLLIATPILTGVGRQSGIGQDIALTEQRWCQTCKMETPTGCIQLLILKLTARDQSIRFESQDLTLHSKKIDLDCGLRHSSVHTLYSWILFLDSSSWCWRLPTISLYLA